MWITYRMSPISYNLGSFTLSLLIFTMEVTKTSISQLCQLKVLWLYQITDLNTGILELCLRVAGWWWTKALENTGKDRVLNVDKSHSMDDWLVRAHTRHLDTFTQLLAIPESNSPLFFPSNLWRFVWKCLQSLWNSVKIWVGLKTVKLKCVHCFYNDREQSFVKIHNCRARHNGTHL